MSSKTIKKEGATKVAPVSNLHDIKPQMGNFYIGCFGGKDRYLRFDMNAFSVLEEKFGSMAEVDVHMASGSMVDLRTLLWAGLLWDETEVDEYTGEPIRYTLSQHKVGSWFTIESMRALMPVIENAVSAGVPDGELSETAQIIEQDLPQTEVDPN